MTENILSESNGRDAEGKTVISADEDLADGLDHPKLNRSLQSRVDALERHNEQLSAALHNAQVKVLLLNHKLGRLQSGVVGSALAPVQFARGLIRRYGRRYGLHLVPAHQLHRERGYWCAIGESPQFYLSADVRWQRLQGWYWLDLVIDSERDLEARFLFDLEGASGFAERNSVSVTLKAKGSIRLPFYVPENCRAVRFDPCRGEARFRLKVKPLVGLRQAPMVSPDNQELMDAWRKLGAATGSWGVLIASAGLAVADGNEYRWLSQSIDPWFRVRTAQSTLRPGWYRAKLLLRSRVRRGVSKLYINFGSGYSENSSVALPYVSGQTVSRVLYLPEKVVALRFDPLECETAFSIEELDGAPISPEEARSTMVAKLVSEHENFIDKTPQEAWAAVQGIASERGMEPLAAAYEAYQALHVAGRYSSSYEDWIEANEAQWFDPDVVRREQTRFIQRPLISIIMPTYNTPIGLLRAAIDSVLRQSYSRWQLCIADDNSTDSSVKLELKRYQGIDSRINVVFRNENGHISAASNSGLALADGEFIALLDHDDQLAEHALHYIVKYINENPDAKILYTDEDKIDIKGVRFDPHFKPDWNPDLCFSQNYVSHLGVYSRELITQIGGFRSEMVGSQDHDLLLRCLPLVKSAEIVHVPMVLYHWRAVAGSTARSADHKGYAAQAGIRALQDFMDKHDEGVVVESGLVPNTYRLRRPIPRPMPLVSLLIPTKDRVDLLQSCIKSIIEKTDYKNFEIVIIDNNSSSPETFAYFEYIQRTQCCVRVVPYGHEFNYSAINNFAARIANGEILGLINNDVEVISPAWLTEMVSHAVRPEIGCVGAKLYYEDNTIQHAGVVVGLGGVAGHSHRYFPRDASGYFYRLKVVQNLSAVTAACLVVRKSVYMQVGGFEEHLKVAFNDVDFCLKVRQAGYRNLWTPYAELYHYESKSRGHEDTPEKMARFASEIEFMQRKWRDILKNDPCYSRNLTLAREDFSF